MSAAREASRKAKGEAEARGRGNGGEDGESVWPEAHARLREDPAFGPLVERVGPVRLGRRAPDAFSFLVRSVVYQQLAGRAAATIHGRVVEALGTVTPAAVLAAEEDALRGAGLSRGKLASIKDLAARVTDGDVSLEDLGALADDEAVERLVRVRGIGRWTAEMALLFHLRRPDVWPVTDLGVRAGAARIFGLAEPPPPRDLELMGVGYRPWRSAAAWYCWRAVEVLPPG